MTFAAWRLPVRQMRRRGSDAAFADPSARRTGARAACGIAIYNPEAESRGVALCRGPDLVAIARNTMTAEEKTEGL